MDEYTALDRQNDARRWELLAQGWGSKMGTPRTDVDRSADRNVAKGFAAEGRYRGKRSSTEKGPVDLERLKGVAPPMHNWRTGSQAIG